MEEASFGGGTGGRGTGVGVGAGMDVPEARESVDGGRGGNVYDAADDRRPLLEVLDEAPTEGRCSLMDSDMFDNVLPASCFWRWSKDCFTVLQGRCRGA